MRKYELMDAVAIARAETRDALQTVYDTLNHGQQQKLVKDEKVKELFDLYGVKYEGGADQ